MIQFDKPSHRFNTPSYRFAFASELEHKNFTIRNMQLRTIRFGSINQQSIILMNLFRLEKWNIWKPFHLMNIFHLKKCENLGVKNLFSIVRGLQEMQNLIIHSVDENWTSKTTKKIKKFSNFLIAVVLNGLFITSIARLHFSNKT